MSRGSSNALFPDPGGGYTGVFIYEMSPSRILLVPVLFCGQVTLHYKVD